MKKNSSFILIATLVISLSAFSQNNKTKELTASDILGNPNYLAISYGGYRGKTREVAPTVKQIKEDMKILAAMQVKILRTYNTKLQETPHLLEAISQLKKEDPNFEMYVMLGVWIDCEKAWTGNPNHNAESLEDNTAEIRRAVNYAQKYPGIVKIIAVGNEAMVHWASSYYVQASVILKWVNYLQDLKKSGKLSKDLWITSSDNFASWGGGGAEYHTEDLTKLLQAVDYVSLHTYPYHDTHYNPVFWNVLKSEKNLTKKEQIEALMLRVHKYAVSQYQTTANFIKSLGISKPIHIGETGWASHSNGFYGAKGSRASDEFKQKLYYDYMRKWTKKTGMSCFYFEAFDEQWKDGNNPEGSENHFGLINLNGHVKYALWHLIDAGVFKGLTRDNKPLTKTYNGDLNTLMKDVLVPQ
jgi:exo-beta-1,3-glucanase (GH17 family)